MGWIYGMIRDYYGMIIWDEYMGWFYGIIFGMIIWDDYIGWLWGYYGMIMGLLWDYIPTPYLLKFQGGYPNTFLETISVPTPPFSFGRLSSSATFQFFSDIMECVVPCMHTFIHPFMHAYIHAYIHACIHTYIHKSLLSRTNHCKLIGQITKSLNGAHRDDPCCWMAPRGPTQRGHMAVCQFFFMVIIAT